MQNILVIYIEFYVYFIIRETISVMGCVKSQNAEKQSNKRNIYQDLQSSILTSKEIKKKILSVVLEQLPQFNEQNVDVRLLVRGSEINFSASKFHSQTHQIANTLLIVKTTKNHIFGGYTPCPWEDKVMYKFQKDDEKKSFLFSLKDMQEQSLNASPNIKVSRLIQKQHAIMNCQNQGPIFGKGHDLHITDECHKNENWCNLGQSYSSDYKFGSDKANRQLSGEIRFLVEEYEIWQIKQNEASEANKPK